MVAYEPRVLIPDYDPDDKESYPGDISPGSYSEAEVEELLEKHKDNPEALQFIRDMLEVQDEYNLRSLTGKRRQQLGTGPLCFPG